MAEQLNVEEVVTIQEMVLAQMFEQEALINLLDKRGLIKKIEFLEEVQRLKARAARMN